MIAWDFCVCGRELDLELQAAVLGLLRLHQVLHILHIGPLDLSLLKLRLVLPLVVSGNTPSVPLPLVHSTRVLVTQHLDQSPCSLVASCRLVVQRFDFVRHLQAVLQESPPYCLNQG